MDLRSTARQLFHETLAALDLAAVLRRKVHRSGTMLHLAGGHYDLAHCSRVILLAVGKAAVPMAHGLLALCDPVPAGTSLEGLVVGTTLPAQPDPRLRYLLGTHPFPTETSLEAASLAQALLARADDHTLVLFLISGGASAMLEAPLDPRIPFADVTAFYRTLVHSGLSIADMNTLRKHLSAVKGGRLATAGPFSHATLLISDVPPDAPDVIGSGPSLPDPSVVMKCRFLFAGPLANAAVPDSIRSFFLDPNCPETPKRTDRAFARGSSAVLLSSDDLCAEAARIAAAAGFTVMVDNRCDEWPYQAAASHLLSRLRHLSTAGKPVCLISAGELAVPLPAQHGIGGRNQQFTLECARQLAAEPVAGTQVAVLSAGTDGIDGNSPAAGAVIDGTTSARAEARGLDLNTALTHCDAYPFLAALGDTIETGPSGTNLRDLRLLLSVPETAEPSPARP